MTIFVGPSKLPSCYKHGALALLRNGLEVYSEAIPLATIRTTVPAIRGIASSARRYSSRDINTNPIANSPNSPRQDTTRKAAAPSLHQSSSMAAVHEATQTNKVFTRDKLFDLTGRVALVTGGGSGIGLMATQALANNGAKVYVTGRTASKLQRVVDTYGKDISGQIIGITADVTSKESIAKLVEEISGREPCLCILVNNAGISSETVSPESGTATEMKENLFDTEKATFEDWADSYKTNVAGPYFTTTAFLPLLQRSTERHQGWSGTVINITSISGLVKTAQHHFAYNASKGAANHLTRMLASEIATHGRKIRINAIAPGVFPSEMTTNDSNEIQKSHIPKEKFEGKVPAARPGKDEDMAQAVLFFAANQYLNGQVLAVDGGYTLEAGQ